MNVKSPNQNFLTFRLTTIKMKADFKRKSNRIAIRQLDTTHKRITTRQIRQYLITLLSALYIYWSTRLKLGSRLLQVGYMWRTLFLCIFKLTCSLFRLTCWFVKLRLLAAFLHIWQQANRKFIQRTFYKLLIKRLYVSVAIYSVCVSVFFARRPVPDPLGVNQKVPRLRGAAKVRETEQFEIWK